MLLPGRCRPLVLLETSPLISPHRPPVLKGSWAALIPGGGSTQPVMPQPQPAPHRGRSRRRAPGGPGTGVGTVASRGCGGFPASPRLIGNDFLLRYPSGSAPLYQMRGKDNAWRITGGSRCSIRWFVSSLYFFPPKNMKAASHGTDDGVESDTPRLCPADPGAVFSAQWQNAYL